MLLSRNWISQYVKIPDISPQALALAVTMSTVEVEKVIDQARSLENVVVGRVLEVVKHPNADRLLVCRVDVKDEELQIICGGENVQKGMLVAVAKVGSSVRWHGEGAPILLEKVKIRGVESAGMIASSKEIGLEHLFPQKSEREILDLTHFKLKAGMPLSAALGIDDVVLEIDNKSMTHRPDLWGQYGLAREVAAIFGARVKDLSTTAISKPSDSNLPLEVHVEDTERCPRYAALVIDKVMVTESPFWLKRELFSLGYRPVNSIVDVTNYVMACLGQPIHAFDYRTIVGNTISIGESEVNTFDALNGVRYKLPDHTLVIKDGKKPVAIAGIIGGANSHITEKTTTVVLEVANFLASSVRRTSVTLGLRTEASARFEKKLDPELVPRALAMAADLIVKHNPEAVVASHIIDKNASVGATQTITLSQEFLDSRLGLALPQKDIVSILSRLHFQVTHKKGTYTVTVPSFRMRDVAIPEDLVEEIARIYGYDKVVPQLPYSQMPGAVFEPERKVTQEVKRFLSRSLGYTEVSTYSFADPRWSEALGGQRKRVGVRNALTPDQQYLRTSLLPGLLNAALLNLRWKDTLCLYEIGRVFTKESGEYAADDTGEQFLPKQPHALAGIAASRGQSLAERFLAAKGVVEQVLGMLGIDAVFKESLEYSFAERLLDIFVHKTKIGSLGILKSDVTRDDASGTRFVFWELSVASMVKYATFSRGFMPLPKYPSISRDVSLVVARDIKWSMIQKALNDISPLLMKLELFDEFTSKDMGDDKKSVAFRLVFASEERTLETKEVEAVMQTITKLLTSQFGGTVR